MNSLWKARLLAALLAAYLFSGSNVVIDDSATIKSAGTDVYSDSAGIPKPSFNRREPPWFNFSRKMLA